MRRQLSLAAVALTGVLFLAACGTDDAGADPGPTAEPGDGADVGNAPLADGEHFGFLTAVDATAGTITLDEAIWVSSDDEPNGYRIDNPDATTVVLAVADAAAIEVLMSTGDPATATDVDVQGLADWFDGPAAGQEVAFNLEVVDGAVATMRFAYRP